MCKDFIFVVFRRLGVFLVPSQCMTFISVQSIRQFFTTSERVEVHTEPEHSSMSCEKLRSRCDRSFILFPPKYFG